MRLLLDEHLSPVIAQALRRRGHDVVAVAERDELRGSKDMALLLLASAERRAVVTSDVRDFARLGLRRMSDRQPHHGVVIVSRRAFPTSRRSQGHLVRALDTLLDAHPGDDELAERVVWLDRWERAGD